MDSHLSARWFERSSAPLTTVIAPFALLWGLNVLAGPTWLGIDPTTAGYGILAAAVCLPLLMLCAPGSGSRGREWAAVGVASLAAVALCAHAGLSTALVADLDAGGLPSRSTILAASGVLIGAIGLPIGVIVSHDRPGAGLGFFVLAPAVTGAVTQLAWFGLFQLVEGAHGASLWMWSRMLIHCGAGAVAGVIAGGARLYAARWPGTTALLVARLPRAISLGMVCLVGLTAAGALRVIGERADESRFVNARLDGYFLALSNLYRAEDEGLAYPALREELVRARSALSGSVRSDPELAAQLQTLAEAIEDTSTGDAGFARFNRAVERVNRRLLATGRPFFLEPHSFDEGLRPVRFVLRYTIGESTRYRRERGGSVPMLRLRRLDRMLVDTPFTGMSYPQLGTILMDHIDDVALRSYGRLFEPGALAPIPEDGRFSVARSMIRSDRHDALSAALVQRGHRDRRILERIAATGRRWEQRQDVRGVRAELDAPAVAAYDALAELLARQTEVHEARHAFDGELEFALPELEELSAGPLGQTAAAEIRAHLTELIDGPLGPRYALAGIARMVAGEHARANAYFFAGVVILEGLWGERIRRPDLAEREGPEGPHQVFLPITAESPGWLSYSRILGAYADLRQLGPDELRQRARELFSRLFREEYLGLRRIGE